MKAQHKFKSPNTSHVWLEWRLPLRKTIVFISWCVTIFLRRREKFNSSILNYLFQYNNFSFLIYVYIQFIRETF